ncbi:MAG: aminomethyl-transferring glycine dehydrogenase subunit GcvPB [Phycisphaerales bacterium]|nr:aminomethyl-transferring glycine dehydrogenase subunit GcvPB [Phycisphaerales bacterium]
MPTTKPTVKTYAIPTRGDRPTVPSIFEKSQPGLRGVDLPALDVPTHEIPEAILGETPDLPELGQLQVARHYSHLCERNFSVDANFYPLGSCTMKYNPRINEFAAAQSGLINLHPMQDEADVQGLLQILFETRRFFEVISGLPEVSLQPAAGAHGEFAALKVIRAYFTDHGQPGRHIVIATDNAHGTNPASCMMCGAAVVKVKTAGGYTDLDDLRRLIDEHGSENIAALMITNPNTAGLFDTCISEVAQLVHDAGAMMYLDGANMNAILGKVRPADFGTDIMHYNTHKTFSTPHGCGGPGSGPIAACSKLAPYLPVPQVVKQERDGHTVYSLDWDRPKSIGKVRSFFGQVGVLVRCWTYIAACGPDGLRNVAETAVLSANYLAARLRNEFEMPFFHPEDGHFAAHEFVTVPKSLLARGVTLLDIAKRLIDYDIHPPTMHWPVHDCLMVEPTETESKETLDRFADAMLAIAEQIKRDAESMAQAPEHAVVRRLDEVAAARKPVLAYERSG